MDYAGLRSKRPHAPTPHGIMSHAPEKLADLSAAPYNPRTITIGALEGLSYSLAEFGDLSGVTFNSRTGHLVAGHQRVKSLRQQYGDLAIVDGGITTPEGHRFSVRVVDWDEAKEKAANVAANTPTISGDFTSDLGDLLDELKADEAETFDALHLDDLTALLESLADAEPEADAQEDAGAPEVDDEGEPDSVRGEVYELGDHRIMCGDCRDPADWFLLLQGDKANLVFTSPPYASQRKYDEASGFKPIHPDEYGDWWDALQAAVRGNLADDGSFFVNIKEHCEDGQRHLYVKRLTIRMVDEWGWEFNDELVWTHAGIPGEVHTKFKNQFEPVFHFCTGRGIKIRPLAVSHKSDHVPLGGGANMASQQGTGKAGKDFAVGRGTAYPGNVLSFGKAREALGHSAAFPVVLPSFFVRAFSDAGDIVLDPFMGSGTTIIAAAEHDRRGFGFEISPKYTDVVRRRWTAYALKHDLDPGSGALD